MDSFCEQPRSAPIPIHVEKTVSSPHVPDVSLILQNLGAQNKPANFNDRCPSYNLWKARKEQARCKAGYEEHNKENDFVSKASGQSSFKKQVRFTGPVLQQNSAPAVKQSNFEQIYIANIPNRHLDLSLVEAPRPIPKQTQIESPRTQSHKQEERVNECPEFNTSKFVKYSIDKQMDRLLPPTGKNTNKHIPADCSGDFNFIHQSNSLLNYKCPIEVEPSKPRLAQQTDNDEPTVKELLKIIKQQNEQMILLQKQVASLLENKNSYKQIEDMPLSTQENTPVFGKKLAIDVMTSFEVSIRQNFPPHRGKFLKEPKIQEITEGDEHGNILHGIHRDAKPSNSIDDTLVLEESLKIQEDSPSPEHSIHVDMQDYSSDEEDSVDVGWTIYNNVMGQVNNILKKTPLQPNFPLNNKEKDRTMQRVKQATLEHLRNLGVSLPATSDSDAKSESSSQNSEYSPSEISFAVKQLLMKYLPGEQLAKIMRQSNQVEHCDEIAKLAKRRPEYSFATLQYMKKYNLLNVNADTTESPPVKPSAPQGPENPKILLDITALKQQPKLM